MFKGVKIPQRDMGPKPHMANRVQGPSGSSNVCWRRELGRGNTDQPERDKLRSFAEQRRTVKSSTMKGAYSVGYWQGFDEGHVSVRIEAKRFEQLKDYLLKRALGTSVEDLVGEFKTFSFLPFAPVR
jgi:hypothetical protein